MSSLLKAECYKLFHIQYFWGLGLLYLFLSSIMLLDGQGKTTNLFFASLYNTPILYFLIIVFAALFAGNDFEQRTLYSYISAGHKRGQVIFVKTLVYEAACFVILICPLLIHGLAGILLFHETFAMNGHTFAILLVIAISILAMCMLPLLFSFIFRDMGKSLVVPMVLFFLMIFMMNGDKAQVITRILPMGQLRLVSLQQVASRAGQLVTTDFWWIVVLYIGAYVGFRCADLK